MFKYYLQESSYRTGFGIRHLKNEKETVMILAIASHFRAIVTMMMICGTCFSFIRAYFAYNKVVLNSTSEGRSLLNTTQK